MIEVNDRVFVSEFTSLDKAALIAYLNEEEIYDNTLAIPYPYTERDAKWWLAHISEQTKKQGKSTSWAIRTRDGGLIGGVGFHDVDIPDPNVAELGYWLAKPFWGQGLMTDVVRKVCDFAFAQRGLSRITAHVFIHNAASVRVLEKAGFSYEGVLEQYAVKEGKRLDVVVYAITNTCV